MGDTKIKATLDGNTISCTYYRIFESSDDISPVDISVQVLHQFVDSSDAIKEIILESFSIPKNYLETKSVSYLSNQIHQKVDFTILNLRYLHNVFIKTIEIRETVSIETIGTVISADDSTVGQLPNNPQKDTENDENIPESLPLPEENIVVLEKEMTSECYTLEKNKTSSIQTGMKIYLDQNIFVLQEYNEESSRLYIEDFAVNFIKNIKFTDQSTQDRIPAQWEIDAPGIIVNSHIISLEDIQGINFWHLRITNPNLFSAFNSVTASTIIDDLQQNLTNLTFSIYYRTKPTKKIPFNSISVTFRYYLDEIDIGHETLNPVWSQEKNKWNLLSATSSVPSNANKYSISLELGEIDTTDLFSFDMCLPQLEKLPFPTTRIIEQRVQDKITTSSEVLLEKPFYISLKTRHKNTTRSLFSSTGNLKNGIEILSTENSIVLKSFDATGNLENNISSTAFIANQNDIVEYGVWITDTLLVEFYLNKNLLSSSSLVASIPDKTAVCWVGSSERENTTINDELLDFKVLSNKP